MSDENVTQFPKPKPEQITANRVTVDWMIAQLDRYGLMRLMKHDDGIWTCRVEVYTNNVGLKTSIASEYAEHTTPHSAMMECLERCREALG